MLSSRLVCAIVWVGLCACSVQVGCAGKTPEPETKGAAECNPDPPGVIQCVEDEDGRCCAIATGAPNIVAFVCKRTCNSAWVLIEVKDMASKGEEL